MQRHRITLLLIFLGSLLFTTEIASRIYLAVTFGTGFISPSSVKYHFYPELRKLENYKFDPVKINLLVLGGSVLFDDTVREDMNNQSIISVFCDPADYLSSARFNVLNLANVAHNSLDSRYKYFETINKHFDYVLFYHGINDSRANNIQRNAFDVKYRHIEFYDDLYYFFRYGNNRLLASPFVIHWVAHSFKKKKEEYIPRELFYGLLSGIPESNVLEGGDIKSAKTFKQNINEVYQMAEARDEILVLSHYCWYLPENYNFEAFRAQELDYDEQLWPTELYGLMENVKAGLEAHAGVIRELEDSLPSIVPFPINDSIPKSGAYFNDICHLNDEGCRLLCDELEMMLIKHSSSLSNVK